MTISGAFFTSVFPILVLRAFAYLTTDKASPFSPRLSDADECLVRCHGVMNASETGP